jgi:hypothetical protein
VISSEQISNSLITLSIESPRHAADSLFYNGVGFRPPASAIVRSVNFGSLAVQDQIVLATREENTLFADFADTMHIVKLSEDRFVVVVGADEGDTLNYRAYLCTIDTNGNISLLDDEVVWVDDYNGSGRVGSLQRVDENHFVLHSMTFVPAQTEFSAFSADGSISHVGTHFESVSLEEGYGWNPDPGTMVYWGSFGGGAGRSSRLVRLRLDPSFAVDTLSLPDWQNTNGYPTGGTQRTHDEGIITLHEMAMTSSGSWDLLLQDVDVRGAVMTPGPITQVDLGDQGGSFWRAQYMPLTEEHGAYFEHFGSSTDFVYAYVIRRLPVQNRLSAAAYVEGQGRPAAFLTRASAGQSAGQGLQRLRFHP